MLIARLVLWPTLLGAMFGLIGLIFSWPWWVCLLLFAPLLLLLSTVVLFYMVWMAGGSH